MVPWISLMFLVISPFIFLTLLIWVFSLIILVRFARGLSILFIFLRISFFFRWFFCKTFLVSLSLIWLLIYFFFISLLLLVLHLAYSCFSRSLTCSIRSFTWEFFVFLIYVFMAINFPLGLPLLCQLGSYKLCFHLIIFQELFYFLPYFFNNPLIMRQCVVQSPGFWVFSGALFVVMF
jgi:hypothetical protein